MRNTVSILLLLASFIALSVSYTTSGNRILDPSGNPILLRGVARPSLEWNSRGEGISEADFREMKKWGANVVRIGLNQGFWLSYLSQYDSGHAAFIDTQVQFIKSIGMGVILDLHWSHEGIINANGAQRKHADNYSIDFWKLLANKYKNDPWVIFELYNEPHDVSYDVWRNGGRIDNFYDTPGFQGLYNAVRSTGANNAVIVNGLDYAFDLKMLPQYALTGTNIIYGTHPYDFDTKMPETWDTNFGFAAATYPLIATEFGSLKCATKYNQDFVNYANQKSISWTAWGWYPQGCGFPSLINSWAWDVSAPAVPVKNSLGSDSKIPIGGTSTTKSATSSSSTSSTSSTTKSATTTTTSTTKSATTAAATTTTTTTTTGSTTGSSGTAIDVFTDSIQNSFEDYSWNSKINDLLVTSPYQSGSKSIKFVASAYNAIYFFKAGFIDTTKHKAIEFYIHGGTAGGQAINFNLIRKPAGQTNSDKIGQDQRVATYTTDGTLSANKWLKATVTLSPTWSGTFDGFWFQDQSGGTQSAVYIDSIRILNK